MNRTRIPSTITRGNLLSAVLATIVLCITVDAQETVWPSPDWTSVEPAEVGLNAEKLADAQRYALTAGGSGMIVRHGRVALRWGDQNIRYDIKSATKSFGATMLGIAIKDGKIALDAPASSYHPTLGVPPESNAQTGWLDEITVRHLVTQTAGFEKPGGYERLLFRPGTQWYYSDGGPNWLAECITLQYQRDLQEVMFDRVFTPLGISRNDLQWRQNQYRAHKIDGVPRREFGAGIHANVEALSRIGYLYLHEGVWQGERILPEDFVALATQSSDAVVGLPEWNPKDDDDASVHYGMLWWNNADAALENVPTDAYWAWGLYDSLIIVVPSLDLVVVRGGANGRSWNRTDDPNRDYIALAPFLEPIVAAARIEPDVSSTPTTRESQPPYPPSEVITDIEWAPAETIVRQAEGSDNWPMTWADDDYLYTAFGDGWGFEPRVENKLSLGLCRIGGNADEFHGINLRSSDIERTGQGEKGVKASGMLMVEGVLYLLVRNTGNSQLAWSSDRGNTWTWADWKFTTSFGCPTFLNFGKNYAGARDDFVYVYSFDSESANVPADRYVMARVPKRELRNQNAYDYFAGLDEEGQAAWSVDVDQREAVFNHPGRCYRSAVTYHSVLKRYLWNQVLPESTHAEGPRFQGGFGVYEGKDPWGPWRTVFFTNAWDVGPGETNSFPTKWMNADGRTLYLVSSGNDCFTVRRARLTTVARRLD